ncbi:MAG: zinc ribbon domain-containing protein [Thermoplasmata archaeon]
MPLGALAIPYYMGFKGPKRFAILGAFILVANSFAFAAVSTQRAYDYSDYYASIEGMARHVEPQFAEGNLSQGVVAPTSGDAETEFTFTVIYTNGENLPPVFVRVIVVDRPVENGSKTITFTMNPTDTSDTNYTNGAEFQVRITLPASQPIGYPEWPNHFFFFETQDTGGTSAATGFKDEDITSYGFGPMNANLLDQYWHSTIMAFNNMLFVIALYFMGVGMYWWLRKARQKSSQWQERVEAMQKEEDAEFECDRCGADVPKDADRCPSCGASFDEDEEEGTEEEAQEEDAEFECDKCGADVQADADKCPKCGEAFDEEKKEPEAT